MQGFKQILMQRVMVTNSMVTPNYGHIWMQYDISDNQKTPRLRRVLQVARGGIEPPTQGFSVIT
jgi:hypothetical protein